MDIVILLLGVSILLVIVYMFVGRKTYVGDRKYIIAMFLTEKHSKEAENAIISLDRVGMKENLVVTCLDRGSYEYMGRLGVERRLVDMGLSKEADFGTIEFYNIVIEKVRMIIHHLQTQSVPILYMDTDVVVLQNLDSDLNMYANGGVDTVFQCDDGTFLENKCDMYCTGFMFIKNNDKTRKCFQRSLEIMLENKKNRPKKNGAGADQPAINQALTYQPDIRVGAFNSMMYANGWRYFDNHNVYKEITPKIVHNNWIRGLDNKIARFKKYGLWFAGNIQLDNIISRVNVQKRFSNDPSKNIFWVYHTDLIHYVDNILPNLSHRHTIVIVDHATQSDDGSNINYKNFLNNDKIVKVFAEDWLGHIHPKLAITPIGVQSKAILNGDMKRCIDMTISPPNKKPLKILSNGHLAQYNQPRSGSYNQRLEMFNELQGNSLVDFWGSRRDRDETWRLHEQYSFELCPEGNGLDTHRFYEALLLNTIPIVKRGALTPLYEKFPCVIVDEWKDITSDNCKRWVKELGGRVVRERYKLNINYWFN